MTLLGTPSRRKILKAGLAGTAVLATPTIIRSARAADERVIYANTWGGSMEEAEFVAYFDPFTEKTGIKVRPVAPMSFSKLKAQVSSGNYEWDLSSTGSTEFHQAVHEGFLEPVDMSVIDKTATQGLIRGNGHGIANMSLGTALVYRKDKFPNGGPQSWADFWDVKKFPGTRALYDRSYAVLSFALLADGVPRDKLYPLDLDRGFKKLDQIKPHIKVWWKEGSQSQQLLRDGEVDMMPMWNARAEELIDRGVPVQIVWNGAQSEMGTWFVPKGTPRAKLAWELISFCVQPERQAIYCTRFPYGPSNPKAFDFIKPADARKMPTAPEYKNQIFEPDSEWLATRMSSLRDRWSQWLAS